MYEARMRGCDFTGSNLNSAFLNHCVAVECSFADTDLEKSNFTHARIQIVRFTAAKLDNACFASAQLINCDFRAAHVHYAKFPDANLSRSVFCRAVFIGCDFRGANLSAADFSDAVLAESLFGDANLMATDLRGTVLGGARELTSTQLTRARTSQTTILPNGAKGPFMRGMGSEFLSRR